MTGDTEGGTGPLRRAIRRLAPDHEEPEERTVVAAASSSATRIGNCGDRSQVAVCGRIRSLAIRPEQTGSPSLEAELYDDTGTVTLIWLGRRTVAGVHPGTQLRAVGRICVKDSRRLMFNPRYDLLPD